MCEYCGCQEIAAIGELTREHDAVVAMISLIRAHLGAGRLDQVAATCRSMTLVLGPHTAVEEQGLFPELADEFPSHIAALKREHEQIEAVLGEARASVPEDPTWPDRLTDALFMLREHILKEQDGVFPAALASLDGDQWARVEAVREGLVARVIP